LAVGIGKFIRSDAHNWPILAVELCEALMYLSTVRCDDIGKAETSPE
jgi:hypothetical protein